MKLFRVLWLLPLLLLAGCNGKPADPYSDESIAKDKTFQNLENSVNKAMEPKPQTPVEDAAE